MLYYVLSKKYMTKNTKICIDNGLSFNSLLLPILYVVLVYYFSYIYVH